ncbi:MAG: hypothetical protein ACR2KV_11900, partial [Solirubrobacteraceae bacterium]
MAAALPVVVVLVLAFLAQQLISSGQPAGPVHSYQTLIAKDLPGQMVRSAVIKTKDNLVDVTLTNG